MIWKTPASTDPCGACIGQWSFLENELDQRLVTSLLNRILKDIDADMANTYIKILALLSSTTEHWQVIITVRQLNIGWLRHLIHRKGAGLEDAARLHLSLEILPSLRMAAVMLLYRKGSLNCTF